MNKPVSFGSIGVEVVSSLDGTRARPAPGTPFRILVLADFSGRASRGIAGPLTGRRPVAVDRDVIDEVMGKMKVSLLLESAGAGLDIPFACLDDFHPDHLFARVGIFRALKGIRDRLGDPRTFNEGLKVIRALTGDAGAAPAAAPAHRHEPPPEGGLLERMIGGSSAGTGQATGGQTDMDAFLASIVRPHLVAADDPEQARLTAVLDRTVSGLMAEVMHHPAFQALEASWRGVQFLCSRIETDETLQVFLLDLSADELEADLAAQDDLTRTWLHRLLVEEARESPWAVLAGDYTFGHDDAAVLGRMAKVARAAGAPFMARADASMVGRPEPDAWDSLRHLTEAAYLGLAMPRFLLRLPFGRDTDAAETFDFEETGEGHAPEHYLWGNPALACAVLLAQVFSAHGWDMAPGVFRDIDGLPLHVYEGQGGKVLTPCAEIPMTEEAAEAILEAGIMPLATIHGTDTARLVRFQSIAQPPAPLAGRWAPS